jgi:hypothetical protein
LEGDTELERAYYVCPKCEGETIFPPGPKAGAEERPLELKCTPLIGHFFGHR